MRISRDKIDWMCGRADAYFCLWDNENITVCFEDLSAMREKGIDIVSWVHDELAGHANGRWNHCYIKYSKLGDRAEAEAHLTKLHETYYNDYPVNYYNVWAALEWLHKLV